MRTWLLSLVVSMLVLVPLPAFAQGINLVGASVEIDGPRPFCFELSGKPVMRSFAITLLVDLDATGRIDLNDKVLDRFPRGGLKQFHIPSKEGKYTLTISPDTTLTITRLTVEPNGMHANEIECAAPRHDNPGDATDKPSLNEGSSNKSPAIPRTTSTSQTVEQRLRAIESRLEALEKLLAGKVAAASQSKPSWEEKLVRVEKFAIEQAGLIQDLIKEFKAIRSAAKK